MQGSSENGRETLREWLAGLPTQEEMLAKYPIEQLLNGIHVRLDGGTEECFVELEPDPIDWDVH